MRNYITNTDFYFIEQVVKKFITSIPGKKNSICQL